MQAIFAIAPLIIILPFAGVFINAFFGRRLMENPDSPAPGIVASVMAGGAFTVALLLFIGLLNDPAGAQVPLFTWMSIQISPERTFVIDWTLRVDTLSSIMMLVVTGVGTLIHIYAIGYMQFDVEENVHKRHLHGAEADEFKRRYFSRFFTFLNLFLGSMLILVTGNTFLTLFVGWELVGLCSFLLIGFWNDDPEKGVANAKAANKAFIVNRVGDFGMLMAIFLLFWSFGSLQFDEVFSRGECMIEGSQADCITLSPEELDWNPAATSEEEEARSGAIGVLASLAPAEEGPGELNTLIFLGAVGFPMGAVVTAITLLMLLGATGKSAQIPLFVWLPDAMAGPTPVSALIHAATMVTAGIYMITRSNVLFHMAPFSETVVAVVGGLTALVAATIAVAQFDIKKVLAYSTISQLGFMIAAVGLGGYVAGIFHLATHAFFKALLFLGSGSVIQGMERGILAGEAGHGDEHGSAHDDEHHAEHDDHHDDHHAHPDPQDMRNMGGLLQRMPTTGWTYIIGSLALAGIVPLAGFWSKDEILLDANNESLLVYILLSVASFLTAFYMTRQVSLVFFGQPRTDAADQATESPGVVTIPLIILGALSVFGGLMNLPFEGFHQLGHWLEYSVTYAHIPKFNLTVAVISTVVALAAIGLGWLVYGRSPSQSSEDQDPLASTGPLFGFLEAKWYWDELYEAVLIRPFTRLSDFFANTLDWNVFHDWFHDTLLSGFFVGGSQIMSKPIDQGVVDGTVNGLANLVSGSSRGLRRIQTGFVRNYALVVALGVVVIVIFLVARFVL
ncbi:MAG: hypothetical protein GYB68_10175 [Chloroflexi bacterium]|nr:hypothetical protein [Chloroflexota bacterium]